MCAANPAERRADTLRDCSNQTSLPSAIPKTSFSCATSKKEISKGSTGDRVNTCNQGYPPLMIGRSDPSVKRVGSNRVVAIA